VTSGTSGSEAGGSPAEDLSHGEEVLTDARGKPVPVESLYLGELSVYRPVVTGDVFENVDVGAAGPAVTPALSMVIAHPSGMRSGATLNECVRAAPLVRDPRLSPKKAATRIADVFALPKLPDYFSGSQTLDQGPWGVRVDLAVPVRSEELDIERRRVCLSPTGIRLLVQCIGHSDTRVTVREDTIGKMLAPKLLEIEWLENWNEDIVRPRVEAGADLRAELLREAAKFEEVMERDRGEGRTLHVMINDLETLPPVEAERIMAGELRARRGE
jgi:hypothetical protein